MPRERSARADRRSSRTGGVRQLDWRTVRNPYRPIEVLTEDQIELIHDASLRILETTGMDFLHPEATALLEAHGAAVDGERVRFDREMVTELVAGAPASFTMHARNPAHHVTVGGNETVFCTVASAPNSSSLDGGRRVGNFADYQDFLRLGQSFNIIHAFGGYPVEPVDLPPETRHLQALSAFVTLTDKVFHAYALGRRRIVDALEIVRIGRGITRDQLATEPSLFTIVNTSSPLRLDGPMIEGLIEMAKMNQVVVITPFTLSGAMAPASIAGALAQQNAEALAAIAFTQLVGPGSPVVYGGFTSNVDMRSGSPAFGTPEYTRAALAGGQLARRYGLPYRSSNANAANAVDAQAAYESQMSLWGAVMGHANLVMHGAGWMEGGLVASFEKFVVDIEMLQMMSEFLTPLVVDDAELAVDAIAQVGPGGHFFGSPHTLERYESAFYSPIVSDWQNFEAWNLGGARTTVERAHDLYRKVLADYETPPLDDSIRAELDDFVGRRLDGGSA
ncbi:MAG: trimethylamine methyltransferase family protein [Acidimicrobiia bacterium]|nr:trimethylamine methyltransferase family protein [Acidimicrobiia bacterium]MDH4306971.1 trimethylamine methyltransferase family protein [Acidimicrobiia bacterium]MDH5294009.1 trimethylamine methyltransferase family protein [Acidimicrobiia bacterium]